MGMFKGTAPSKMGGGSMWWPNGRGDTSKMWNGGFKSVNMNPPSTKMVKNPGGTNKGSKSGNCPFC